MSTRTVIEEVEGLDDGDVPSAHLASLVAQTPQPQSTSVLREVRIVAGMVAFSHACSDGQCYTAIPKIVCGDFLCTCGLLVYRPE